MGTFATTTTLDTLLPGVGLSTSTSLSLASRCIDWAEGIVRSKLSCRYDVGSSPFDTSTSIPPQVSYITEMMAAGYLFKFLSRGSKESLTRGKAMVDDAMSLLDMLCDSKMDLLDTAGSFIAERTDSVSETIIGSVTGYHTTFDEDDPLNWSIDSDKVSDIASGRS